MRRIFLWGVVIAAAALFPWLTAPALVGYGVYRWNARRDERRMEMDGDYLPRRVRRRRNRVQRSMRRELGRDLAREHSIWRGFDQKRLPVGLKADLSSQKATLTGYDMAFEAAGIPGLVRAEARWNNITYSFPLKDETRLDEVRGIVSAMGGSAAVTRGRDGAVVVTANSAVEIDALARAVYPSKPVDVSRETWHVRQWRVDGCASYEEAERKLAAKREADPLLRPENSYVVTRDTVGGVPVERSNGAALSADAVSAMHPEPGTFIVTEVESASRSGKAVVPVHSLTDDSVRTAALYSLSGDGVEVRSGVMLADGTPEGVKRYVRDGAGEYVEVRRAGGKGPEGLKAGVVCRDIDALADLLRSPGLPEGTFLSVSRGSLDPVPGEFLVELDVDSDVFSRLSVQGGASPSVLSHMESMGVTEADYSLSVLEGRMGRDGYCPACLTGEVSLEKARVNGVPLSELAGRLSDARMPALDRDGVSRWLDDAAMIRAVNVEVDPRRAELRINTVVGNVLRKEVRPMSDEDIRSFAARGSISRSEMKDLAMAVFPDVFRSYSVGGRSVFEDPVRDFLAGRKPATVADMLRRQAEENRRAASAKHSAGPSL